ncbi:MAG: NPCBM/NEW2 domain-containing protein [Leadbetterella sp.]|nr:NPCBM/NEW2 domain-containing protein [Leadbetterella sp.]
MASSYTGSRSGSIVLKDEESSLTYTITVSQGTFGPDISLTTLIPTNNNGEWTGYGSARFDGKTIDGNTIQVSGVQYFQGIGTHADSRMVFDLSGGGYTTFYGKVGRSDDADNGSDLGKVMFKIKTDGSEVWASVVHGNTTGAQSFSINVSGKSTLELIVDKYSDENYYDHANWIDVYLSGGGTPCTNAAPTGVTASPSSHGSGGGNTTLTANCSPGSTVLWSTGHTGSAVTLFTGSTTTYTAKCTSGTCPESSPVAVAVTVGTSGCGVLTHDLVLGYWTVTGHPLVAKYFNGSWWLVQKINDNPEQFLVRGSEMLTRGDVTMPGGNYSGLVGCFAYTYSDYGGLQPPSSVIFETPGGV